MPVFCPSSCYFLYCGYIILFVIFHIYATNLLCNLLKIGCILNIILTKQVAVWYNSTMNYITV